METITYEEIVKAWKTGIWDEDFLDRVERWLEHKQRTFENVRIKDVLRWLAQLTIVIEIGCALDPERFEPYRKYWQELLLKSWQVDLDRMVVVWRNLDSKDIRASQ